MNGVKENYLSILNRLSKVCSPNSITIVGATKKQDPNTVRQGIEAGIIHLGNNVIQDGKSLMAEITDSRSVWHFLGHIQSRKVRDLTAYDCVQTLDRSSIALALNAELEKKNKKLGALIQVNIGNEPQKSGIGVSELEPLLECVQGCSHIDMKGLMCLPPNTEPEKRVSYFRQMRKLYDKYAVTFGFEYLSMGMSGDLEIAVSEGSNMIRVGTALYGDRN